MLIDGDVKQRMLSVSADDTVGVGVVGLGVDGESNEMERRTAWSPMGWK